MKHVVFLLLVTSCSRSFSQVLDTISNKAQFVTVRGKVDLNYYGKGTLWMKGYAIDVDREEIEKFSGKRIRITGKLIIIPDPGKRPKEYDQNGNEIIYQACDGSDTRYVLNPKINFFGSGK